MILDQLQVAILLKTISAINTLVLGNVMRGNHTFHVFSGLLQETKEKRPSPI